MATQLRSYFTSDILRLPAALLDSPTTQPDTQAPTPATNAITLTSLPAELLLFIIQSLPLFDRAALALTAKPLARLALYEHHHLLEFKNTLGAGGLSTVLIDALRQTLEPVPTWLRIQKCPRCLRHQVSMYSVPISPSADAGALSISSTVSITTEGSTLDWSRNEDSLEFSPVYSMQSLGPWKAGSESSHRYVSNGRFRDRVCINNSRGLICPACVARKGTHRHSNNAHCSGYN